MNKNVVLLGAEEFAALGEHKLLINTGLSPSYEISAVREWLKRPNTYLSCDSDLALGDLTLLDFDNVYFKNKASGGDNTGIRAIARKGIGKSVSLFGRAGRRRSINGYLKNE